jgi:hypothetical protein
MVCCIAKVNIIARSCKNTNLVRGVLDAQFTSAGGSSSQIQRGKPGQEFSGPLVLRILLVLWLSLCGCRVYLYPTLPAPQDDDIQLTIIIIILGLAVAGASRLDGVRARMCCQTNCECGTTRYILLRHCRPGCQRIKEECVGSLTCTISGAGRKNGAIKR